MHRYHIHIIYCYAARSNKIIYLIQNQHLSIEFYTTVDYQTK